MQNQLRELLATVVDSLRLAASANHAYVLLAVAMYYGALLLYAVRWKLVLNHMGFNAPIHVLAMALLGGIFVNNVTPTSRAGGELLRAAFVSAKRRIPLLPVFTSIVYERIVESVPVMALAAWVLLYSIETGGWDPKIALPVLLLAGLIVGVLKYWDRLMNYIVERFRLPSNDNDGRARIGILMRNRRLFAAALVLSAAIWIQDVARLYVIALALGWEAPLAVFAGVSVIYLVLGVFSITPGGLGIVEGGLAAALAA
ncbi:MAG: lysylphosphatidylglycerol synthase transmembrane domain-containing protein, partial [Candidatus Korarchaeota archaeon]|nr:lysylphosphatidylglycerol synthase transmembrane domain-containing protein [Candidatus Korarchaeota archaeon]